MRASEWCTDAELGHGFLQKTLHFPPDYDGEVTATLVRRDPRVPQARGSVLYLHGFIDYFFHRHVADAFAGERFDVYALDLRKYGRSLGAAHPHPNFCRSMSEYAAEMSAALEIVAGESAGPVVVLAHSTGAIPALLYAADGEHRSRIARIVLNSPFLDFKEPRWLTRVGAAIGAAAPFAPKRDPVNRWYGPSLHRSAKGEWDFNLRLKPLDGFVAYLGWVRAVVEAHDRIGRGLALAQPILVLHSDRSLGGDRWREEFHRADLILDVEDIKRLAPRLGSRVRLHEVRGARHDVLLSQADARAAAFRAIFDWLR